MREIKFRGKRLDFGNWEYGNLIIDIEHDTYAICGGVISDYHKYPKEYGKVRWADWIDCKTIGQFTGLKDAYDEEIYEGDIVRDEDVDYIVTWSNQDGMFKLENDAVSFDFGQIDSAWLEVIGNIHEKEVK